MDQELSTVDPKTEAKKQKAAEAALQERFAECYESCLKAHEKPLLASDQTHARDELVQLLMDEDCAREDERERLLAQKFEYVQTQFCRCLCDRVAEVKLKEKTTGQDDQDGAAGSHDLDLAPKFPDPA